MIVQLNKTTCVAFAAIKMWEYNKDTDVTTFTLHKHKLTAKGDWTHALVSAAAVGAVWTCRTFYRLKA